MALPTWPPPEWGDPYAPQAPPPDAFLPPEGADYPTFAPNTPEQALQAVTAPVAQPGPQSPNDDVFLNEFGITPAAARNLQSAIQSDPNNPVGESGDSGVKNLTSSENSSSTTSKVEETRPSLSGEYRFDKARELGEAEGAFNTAMAQGDVVKAQRLSATHSEIGQSARAAELREEGMKEYTQASELNKTLHHTNTDPDRAIKRMGSGKRVGLIIAGALAGWLDVARGGNRLAGVTKMISDEVESDIQAQMEDHKQRAYAVQRDMEMAGKKIYAGTQWIAAEEREINLREQKIEDMANEYAALMKTQWADPLSKAQTAAAIEAAQNDLIKTNIIKTTQIEGQKAVVAARTEAQIAAAGRRFSNQKEMYDKSHPPVSFGHMYSISANTGKPVELDPKTLTADKKKALNGLQVIQAARPQRASNDLRTWAKLVKGGIISQLGDRAYKTEEYTRAKAAALNLTQASTPTEITGVLQKEEWERVEAALGVSVNNPLQGADDILAAMDLFDERMKTRANALARNVDPDFAYNWSGEAVKDEATGKGPTTKPGDFSANSIRRKP